jgi:hypothetical protein
MTPRVPERSEGGEARSAGVGPQRIATKMAGVIRAGPFDPALRKKEA